MGEGERGERERERKGERERGRGCNSSPPIEYMEESFLSERNVIAPGWGRWGCGGGRGVEEGQRTRGRLLTTCL